jgi:hypothetical protein
MRNTFPLIISSVERKSQVSLQSSGFREILLETAFSSKMESANCNIELNFSPVLLQDSNEASQLCKKSRLTLFQSPGLRENTPGRFSRFLTAKGIDRVGSRLPSSSPALPRSPLRAIGNPFGK